MVTIIDQIDFSYQITPEAQYRVGRDPHAMKSQCLHYLV